MGADKERFTTPLPNHLHCRVCLEISYPAVIVCVQEHQLCRPCAERIEESGEPECPLCLRQMKLPLRESLLLRRAVEDYQFTCRHEECDWTGSVVDEDEHEEQCDFGRVECPLCKALCTRVGLDEHQGVCPNARIPCPKGGDVCASGEPDGLRNRGEMQEHLDAACAQWQCIEGCRTRTTRANLAHHEAACKASAARIAELEAAIEAEEVKVSTLKLALARSKAAL